MDKDKEEQVGANALRAPCFRAFGIEPASGLAASRFNHISQVN